jgi:hypothetical protein
MAHIGPLFVKIVASPSVPGGKCLALVTQDGEFVGDQQRITVDNEVNDIATITVRFIIDGERIRFGSNDA